MLSDACIGWVRLAVADVKRSLRFYNGLMGMNVFAESAGRAVLGSSEGEPIVILEEEKGVKPSSPGTRGLYHYALLLPSRRDLARMFARLAHGWGFDGFADHLVSEAVYLRDPDGHGIEVYADRAVERWRRTDRGEIQMATLPLDVDLLLEELRDEGLSKALAADWVIPSETRVGHIHLRVSSLRKAEEFYHGLLGFDVTNRSYPGALFMSRGGYHHHVGVNIWAGENAPPPSANHARLKSFAIKMPSEKSLQQVVQNLRGAGVEVIDGLASSVEGFSGVTMRDFDGNLIELAVETRF